MSKLKLVIIHQGVSALPEIEQYKLYFSKKYDVSISNNIKDAVHYDIVWLIMGFYRYRKRHDQILIQEFPSLSLPPFATLKNFIKSKFIPPADIRVFLNKNIEEHLYLKQCQNIAYRDMGVGNNLLDTSYDVKSVKEYDLMYVGSMEKEREIEKVLIPIIEKYPQIKIALLGRITKWIKLAFDKYFENIFYIGFVHPNLLPEYLNKTRAALNLIPDKYPFNIQTSTKLLEYVAFGVPIVTTDSKWSVKFLKDNNIPYLTDHEYLSGDSLKMYNSDLGASWEDVINKSGIEKMLLTFKSKQ